jgi:hypothetical protein
MFSTSRLSAGLLESSGDLCMMSRRVAAAWASLPGTAWAYLSRVVETRWWSSRRDTTTMGTPGWSISVAMKWRRSCSRKDRSQRHGDGG